MRTVFGVWDQYKDQANELMKNMGWGDNNLSCQVREVSTGNIGWVGCFVVQQSVIQRAIDLLQSNGIPSRYGSYGDKVTFDQAIEAEGFERV